MLMSEILYPEDLPADCISSCTVPGQDASDEVEYWLNRLDFQVDPEAARAGLAEYGAWDDEDLSEADPHTLSGRVLWLACCHFNDGYDYFTLTI